MYLPVINIMAIHHSCFAAAAPIVQKKNAMVQLASEGFILLILKSQS